MKIAVKFGGAGQLVWYMNISQLYADSENHAHFVNGHRLVEYKHIFKKDKILRIDVDK